MSTPFTHVVVTGHTLRYGVQIPPRQPTGVGARRVLTQIRMGAALVHRLLAKKFLRARIKVIDLATGTINLPQDQAQSARVWDMVWARRPDPAHPDLPPEALRIRAVEDLACYDLDLPDNDLTLELHPYPSVLAKSRPAVYVVLDASAEYDPELILPKGANPGLVVIQLTCPAGPPDVSKLTDFLGKVRQRSPLAITVTSDRFLKAVGLPITDDRSCEGFADDCFRELWSGRSGTVAALVAFDHLIVRHKAFAAVHLVKPATDGQLNRLHYVVNPSHQFSSAPGFLRGYNSLLGASVLAQAVSPGSDLDRTAWVDAGVMAGLKRCIAFAARGFLATNQLDHQMGRIEAIFQDALPAEHDIHAVPIPPPGSPLNGRAWSILDVVLRQNETRELSADEVRAARVRATEFGRDIVRAGLDATAKAQRFPVIRFGKLTIVDRRAFEDVWEIQAAMLDYLGRFREINRPLCLAVFGAPGGGKSFAVKELAESLGNEHLHREVFEVNVSQYDRAEELAWVFREVRDVALQGKVPLVIFDEFDTAKDGRSFGWQQTFLSPMQDGKFGVAPDQIVFRHGIFVFVGGVNHTFDMFLGRARNREFIEAKGPDFVSRLVRNLNVLGIKQEDQDDLTFVVRRAVLLRDTLWKYQRGIFRGGERGTAEIDDEVVRALLTVPDFRHGVRSLEAIVRTSRLGADRPRFHWAALPPPSQLDMHVDVAKLSAARTAL